MKEEKNVGKSLIYYGFFFFLYFSSARSNACVNRSIKNFAISSSSNIARCSLIGFLRNANNDGRRSIYYKIDTQCTTNFQFHYRLRK